MKLFPAKCHERATLRKLWRQTGNSSLLPGKQFTVTREMLTAVARDRWNLSSVFKFCFVLFLLYNKSLNDWSLGEKWILFPSNLNVCLDFVSGNIEILGKQNSLFPSGPVIKCLLSAMWRENKHGDPLFLLRFLVISNCSVTTANQVSSEIYGGFFY